MRHGKPSATKPARGLAFLRQQLERLLLQHPVLFIALLLSVSILLIAYHGTRQQSRLVESQALQNALLLSRAITEFRTAYTSEVVQRLGGTGIQVTHDYLAQEGSIPLPATLSILLGSRIGEVADGAYIRLYSPYPFPWRKDKGGLRDAFDRAAWEALSRNPGTPFHRIEQMNGKTVLRLATADLMRPACVNCHNSHDHSPRQDWVVGDTRGILEVIAPLEATLAQSRQDTVENILIMLILTLLLLGLVALLLRILRRQMETTKTLASEMQIANQRLSKEMSQRRETQRDLARRARELERSNQDLEQFAYVASHDLQEPLRKIRAFGDRLNSSSADLLPPDSRTYLDRMQGAAERMQQLITDLLTFSRISKQDFDFQRTDLDAVMRMVLQDMEVSIDRLEARVEVDPLGSIDAIPLKIRQLFQNLLSNALKFSREDTPPDIRITCRQGTLGVKAARFISIQDNGIGLEEKYRDRIFKMFQRLHGRGVYDGTGIGLAICKRIVEQHGGTLTVSSEPGNGAVFTIGLPVEQLAATGANRNVEPNNAS